MSVKQKIARELGQWVDKAKDEKTRQRVKGEVYKRLKQGKKAIARLQREFNDPANRAKAMAQVKRAEVALVHLKKEAIRRERQAVSYVKKNPEKALVIAVTAGAAAAALLMVIRRKFRG